MVVTLICTKIAVVTNSQIIDLMIQVFQWQKLGSIFDWKLEFTKKVYVLWNVLQVKPFSVVKSPVVFSVAKGPNCSLRSRKICSNMSVHCFEMFLLNVPATVIGLWPKTVTHVFP